MATLSSHVLDSVTGDHAKNIRVVCVKPGGSGNSPLFDVMANESGRISESIDVEMHGSDIELQFYAADYFARAGYIAKSLNPMPVVVVRLNLANGDAQYHVPLVLSPHSYTLWWSGLPE